MIGLKTLKLTNFTNIEEVYFDFTNRSTVLISGDIGSGKSSLFAAIAICFTDRRTGDSYRDYVRRGRKTARIELTAAFFGKEIKFDYKIYNKKYGAPMTRQISYDGQDYHNSDASSFLQSFNISFLDHIMFSMQGDRGIIKLRPSERASLLKNVMNFKPSEKIDILEQEILTSQEELTKSEIKKETLESQTETFHDLKRPLSETAIESHKVSLEKLKQELATLRVKEDRAKEVLETLKKKRDDREQSQNRKEALQRSITDSRVEISKIKSQLLDTTKDLSALPTKEAITKEVKELTTTAETERLKWKDLQETIETSTESINNQVVSISQLSTHIKAHEKGECTECGQSTDPKKVPELLQTLEEKKKIIDTLKQAKELAAEKESKAQEVMRAAKAKKAQLEYSIEQNVNLKIKYESMITRYNSRLDELETRIKKDSEYFEKLNNDVTTLSSEISELSAATVHALDTSSLLSDIQEVETILTNNRAVVEKNDLLKDLNEKAQKAKDKRLDTIKKLSAKVDSLILSIQTAKECKRILETVLPNFRTIKMCAELEDYINEFVQAIRPGLVTKLYQNKAGIEFLYSPHVPESDEEWLSAKMASGFEKELLATAWRVALGKAYGLTTLFLDEIDSAANSLMSEKMFSELARVPDFEQLFIISHRSSIALALTRERDNLSHYVAYNGEFMLQEEEQ